MGQPESVSHFMDHERLPKSTQLLGSPDGAARALLRRHIADNLIGNGDRAQRAGAKPKVISQYREFRIVPLNGDLNTVNAPDTPTLSKLNGPDS